MPWKVSDVDRFVKGLTPKQKRQWTQIANTTRQECIDKGGKVAECDALAVKTANGALKEHAMQPIAEKGRVLNAGNETALRQVAKIVQQILASLKKQDSDEDETTPEAETTEAATFNQTDTYTLLQTALAQSNPGTDTYIADVYEDQGMFVFRKGYNGGYWRVDFDVASNGTVTLGNPEAVVRKVTYISPTQVDTEESAQTPIETDVVQLVEKAIAPDGTVLLKLIAPGWGSSGYYREDVLKRDGPKVFKAGLHNFIDHPTPEEEAAQPEGSITRIGSVLVEDAHWKDQHITPGGKNTGPGLYARAKVAPGFAETLDAIAGDIGTSIRATGKAKIGEAEGRKGTIIEAITGAKSVDYVTLPGAGGKVLSLLESQRKEQTTMTVENAELLALREEMRAMQTTLRETTARNVITTKLAGYSTLPVAARDRIVQGLLAAVPLTESNTVDVPALLTATERAVDTELQYLQQIGAMLGVGAITGFGSSNPTTQQPPDVAAELTAIFSSNGFGLTESAAKIAANGG